MGTIHKREHHFFVTQVGARPKNWRVLPNPRKREATDVLIIRYDA